MIADSVVAIAMQIEANPASLHDRMILPTRAARPPAASAAVSEAAAAKAARNADEFQSVVHSLLCARYGDDSVVWTPPTAADGGLFYIMTEGAEGTAEGTVVFPALEVSSEDAELAVALKAVLADVANVTRPLALI